MSSMIDIQIPFSKRLRKKSPFLPKQIKNSATKTRTQVHVLNLSPYLTTTLPRRHNRNGKKFNYTNTIQHLFVIKSVTCFFQNSLSQFIFILSEKKSFTIIEGQKALALPFSYFFSSFLMTWLHGGSNLNERLYGLAGYLT